MILKRKKKLKTNEDIFSSLNTIPEQILLATACMSVGDCIEFKYMGMPHKGILIGIHHLSGCSPSAFMGVLTDYGERVCFNMDYVKILSVKEPQEAFNGA